MKQSIEYYSVKELLKANNKYIIPRYQRNYAWGDSEICQLIQDVADYVEKGSPYYIGTLVVHENSLTGIPVYEIIDGQQRFTTLTILLCLLKTEYKDKVDTSWFSSMNLQFQSRESSSVVLNQLFQDKRTDEENPIISGYHYAKVGLKRIIKDAKLTEEQFCDYFFNKVMILRVSVPDDTDLNHYFEIMNTRGVQLEKHEILKASFLEALDEDERYIANRIWESCANMERYVQYGFTPAERDSIFGNDWNSLKTKDVVFSIKQAEGANNSGYCKTIEELIATPIIQNVKNDGIDDGGEQRFNTIINFSNFLLHVLRIQTGEDVKLDDKRLLESFNQYGEKDGKRYEKEFVKGFIYNLLKIKYLYDRYVLKREFYRGTDHWSLQKLVLNDRQKSQVYYKETFESDNNHENREILMLLSMFHVSTPTLVYKHWLNAVLKWLYDNYSMIQPDEFRPNEYRLFLQNLAKHFMCDRYLVKEPIDFYNMIYKNEHSTSGFDFALLDRGTDVENFVFNYLDYLLWKDYSAEKKYFYIEGHVIEDNKIKDFEYTFRSSVEHYYPQHPIAGIPQIEPEWLDNFGNLCLISSSKNSRLSNNTPNAKKDYYKESSTIDSIKQRIMMEYNNWDTKGANGINEIEEHGKKMKELLRQVINC